MAKTKQKKQRTEAKTPVGRFFKWFGIILGSFALICVTTCAILACYGAVYVQNVIMPEVQQSSINLVTSKTDLNSNIYYYDSSSKSYATAQTLYASENRVWVDRKDIPKNLINATVAIEDKRFWSHSGVDWKRTAAAVKYMLTGQSIQGGSTITQQLIKNLTGNNETTVRRKVLEIFEAIEFDRTHTKEDTIEWYLNAIYLGHGCYGVSTASQKYFGKSVSDLSLAQCASLISITNNPSKYDPYSQPKQNLERRNLVLDQMYEQGYITKSARDDAKQEALKCVYGTNTGSKDKTGSGSQFYSWYTDSVIDEVIADLEKQYGYDETTATNLIYSGGLQIYSCLDPNVQKQVDAVYTDSSNFSPYASRRGQALRSGITVVNNSTGAVVALAGGVGEKDGNRIWNCATKTLRPPGSSIKPIAVYAPAIEAGLILPSTAEDDSPFSQNSDGTLWPVNDEGYYSGLTDVDTAVQDSLNTVSVKVLDTLGLKKSYNFLTKQFGITTLVDNYETSTGAIKSDLNYAPLALGGLTKGLSTLELASAYAAFPRNGVYSAPYLYTVVTDSNGKVVLSKGNYSIKKDSDKDPATINGQPDRKTILSTSTAYYMNEMLQHVVTNGTGKLAKLNGMSAAGKTGTTTDDHDRWFAGYTPYYTAAIWTGYDSPESVNASVNPACVLWRKVMSGISQGEMNIGFQTDLKIVQATYCTASGDLATAACRAAGCAKTGNFVDGDQPTTYCTRHAYSNGSVILDYSRTGAAAKAHIHGEVHYIPKKAEKKAEDTSPDQKQPQSGDDNKTTDKADTKNDQSGTKTDDQKTDQSGTKTDGKKDTGNPDKKTDDNSGTKTDNSSGKNPGNTDKPKPKKTN